LGLAQILHTRLSTSLTNLLPIFSTIAIDPLVSNLCGIQGGIGNLALHCSGWGQQFEGQQEMAKVVEEKKILQGF
jgi:hypothetical protein